MNKYLEINNSKNQEQNENLMEQVDLITNILKFTELLERKPLSDEIITNIGEQVDENCLKKFLSDYKGDGNELV